MIKYIIILFSAVLPLKAQIQVKDKLVVALITSYKQDNLKWSIAGNLKGQNPNIYSELIWKKLKGPHIEMEFAWNLWKKFIVQANASISPIWFGSATDTDYQNDNRTDPVFSASLNSNKGNTRSLQIKAGYQIGFSKFKIIPFVGWGTDRQYLHLLDDNKLNSTYKTNWNGFLISVNPEFELSGKFILKGGFTYHQVTYRALADWNLISEFQHPVSFKHTANGYGFEGKLTLIYKISKRFGLFVSGKYSHWNTGKGIDQLFLTSGDTYKTQLNEVIRNYQSLGIGAAVTF